MIVVLILEADGVVVLISSVCPLVDEDKRLVQTSLWEGLVGGWGGIWVFLGG